MSGIDRREFLQFAGGVIVLLSAPPLVAQESGRFSAHPVSDELSAWLNIAEDGTITVYTGKVEVGQNARTSLTQAAADELNVAMESVRLVMGDTDVTPYDMGTFGSRTTPTMVPQIRRAAATAREMLQDLASKAWSIDPAAVVVSNGKVLDTQGGRSATFGELTKGKKLVQRIRHDESIHPPQKWTIAGHSLPKVNGPDFVTGRHRYAADMTRPGMWHGRVLRAPAFGTTLTALDTKGVTPMGGVVVVRDGDFAGVAAARAPLAAQALAALRPQWKGTPQKSNSDTIYDDLRKRTTPVLGGRTEGTNYGSLLDGMAAATWKLERTYTVAYIAHVPLEPRAAVAEWTDGKLTVWTGTQRPFAVRAELADALHISESKVRVIVPDTGSGYGGKHTGECAIEAARLARAAGRPVRVVWSREEEMTWAYFRPAGVIDVRSGADKDGTLLAWEFHNYNSGPAAIRTPYRVENQHIEYHACDSPLRQGSYRGLAATANHFAREVHMDELAQAAKIDPLEIRHRNLKDARLRAVLDAAAERFGWGMVKNAGIACGVEKDGYTATCAEVRVDGGGDVHVVRLVSAFDCGAVVNPDQLRNQIEGALMMGLGGALFESIGFRDGRIVNDRLSKYRVPRFSDLPQIEVLLLDHKDIPSAGAGETPIVGVAPAVAGAIFAATGVRLRALPMIPSGAVTADLVRQ
ncbi:MAG TPA: molybdopterin cofactor-binding domain-containing protein [Thermoanaerobaculia bacterium]|nr:molybdopterin cofactor-binding domain-containing protein [Thermoanaerobaculia bacterium]